MHEKQKEETRRGREREREEGREMERREGGRERERPRAVGVKQGVTHFRHAGSHDD